MIQRLRNVYGLLDASQRRRLYGLVTVMIFAGLVEAVGIASVLPFVTLLGSPETIETNAFLASVRSWFRFEQREDFLIALGLGMGVLVLSGLALKLATTWMIQSFAQWIAYDFSCRLLRHYLNQPYAFFLSRHSADLSKTVLQEVRQLAAGLILPSLNMLVNGILAFFMVALVILVEPVVGLSTMAFLAVSYATIYALLRPWLSRIGVERLAAVGARFRVAQEAFAGVKDVKVLGLEDASVEMFEPAAARLAQANIAQKVLSVAPSLFMQAAVFTVILATLTYLLSTRSGGLVDALPTIVLFTLAGSRTLAALNQVYEPLAVMRVATAAVDMVLEDIRSGADGAKLALIARPGSRPHQQAATPLEFKTGIRFDAVSFTFQGVDKPTIEDLNLEIGLNETVAFVGPTGAGKTTTVDMILGLVAPSSGCVLIDDAPLEGELLDRWRRRTGYVSQNVFLKDDSIAANIAFGAASDQIDMEAVTRAARLAKIDEFARYELEDGYMSKVGDRGVRLSGGQRQRIAIARALYHDPAVLVLDEATSALDNQTERAVMDAVGALARKKTVIIVAHRLSTIRNADRIFYMESGRLIASGSFDELLETTPAFRAMAGGVDAAVEV